MKIVGKTPARLVNEGDANQPAEPTLNVEVTIPLKYVSIFGDFLICHLNLGTNIDLKSETAQSKNNNLDYLIDLTFRNINRLFVLSFKNDNDGPKRDSFYEYYMSLLKLRILVQ